MDQLVFFLVLLVVAFLNWGLREGGFRKWMSGDSEQAEPRRTGLPPSPPFGGPGRGVTPPRPSAGAGGGGRPDAELRKFMEALGLPVDAEPPPIPEAPVRKVTVEPPAPRPVRPATVSRPQARSPRPTPRRPVATRPPVFEPESEGPPVPDVMAGVGSMQPRETGGAAASIAAAAQGVGRAAEAQLGSAEFPAAVPRAGVLERSSGEAYRHGGRREQAQPARDRLLGLLRSNEDVRRAVLLREILDPPVALRGS